MSYPSCFARHVADVAAVLTHPVLVGRILRRGNSGISVTSQLLHVVLFSLRYADTESWLPRNLMYIQWPAIARIIIFGGAIAIPIAMAYRASTEGRIILSRANTSRVLSEMLIYMVPAFLIAYRFNYTCFSWVDNGSFCLPPQYFLNPPEDTDVWDDWDLPETWHPQTPSYSPFSTLLDYFSVRDLVNMDKRQAYEVAWSTSIFLAAIADIPQYITYYRHVQKKVDWWLVSSLALAALSRTFYMVHWVLRYIGFWSWDPVGFVGGLVQVLAFLLFLVLVVKKVIDVLSESNKDLEAQIREFDPRWGQGSEAEIPVVDVEKK
ncbi:hypothetical protein FRC15_005256 [Serendipita sp. 397]|nr:hypothetical protein FRC15_005256 [Serendipita sp. 397]